MLQPQIQSSYNLQIATPSPAKIPHTDPKKTQVVSQNSEEQIRRFIKHIPAPAAMVDRQMRYLAVSERWQTFHAPPSVEMIGLSHYEFLPKSSEYNTEMYQRCLSSGTGETKEDYITRPDGSVDIIKWDIQPWYNSAGEIGGLILFSEIIPASSEIPWFQMYQIGTDKAADAIFWFDADAHIIYANEAASRLVGHSKQELLKLKFYDINPNFSPAIWLEHWQVIERFQNFTFEGSIRQKNSNNLPVEITVSHLEINSKEYHYCVIRDISHRKQIEITKNTALEQLQAVLDAVPCLVSWISSDLRYIGVNRHLANAFDLPAETFIGQDVGFLESSPKLANWVRDFFASSHKTAAQEITVNLNDGPRSYLIVAQKYNQGTRAVFVGVDITQRKQAETALQNAKDQLQAVLDAVPGLVSWIDADLQYLGVNQHLAAAFNLPGETFVGQEVGFMENRPGFADFVRKFFASSQQKISEELTLWLENISRNYLIVAQKYHQGSKAVFVGLDITERKQMEAELRRSKNLYRTLARNFPNGSVCLFDSQLRYTLAEGTELTKIGLSKHFMQGKTLWEVWPPETSQITEPLYRAALAGQSSVVEIPYANQIYLTHILPVKNEQGEVLAGLVMTQNITESKQAEKSLRQSQEQFRQQAQELERTLEELKQTQTQLIQTEKMSSLGQLVAGIAHEINNPVSFIYGNLAYARQYTQALLNLVALYGKHYPQPHPEIQENIDKIGLEFLREDFLKLLSSMEVGADRIREVVLSLRNFSRLDEAQKKPVDIHTGIDSTLLILQSRLKAKASRPGIEVIKEYSPLPLVTCYAGQLNQVFMNLISNAIDAIEESSMKNKTAKHPSKEALTKDKGQIKIRTTITENKTVEIHIKDNGMGINESVKNRVFEPFFTTKPLGKGTGLGLSISYQIIVEKHGGNLTCHSLPSEGSEFVISIPLQ